MFTCGLFLTNFSLAMAARAPLASGSSVLADDLVPDAAGHRGVVGTLHGVGRPALGTRSEVRRVAEHRPQGDQAGDGLYTMACLLYTSDAADERSSVDLGGRRIIKK